MLHSEHISFIRVSHVNNKGSTPPGRVLCERLSALLVYSVIVIVSPVLFHRGGLMYKSSVQYTEYALLLAFFSNCMFYQLHCVSHSSSSTQAWGSVLQCIVETRDQNSRGCPFSFRIGIWDLFVHRGQKSYTPTAFWQLWTTPRVRCMKHASS